MEIEKPNVNIRSFAASDIPYVVQIHIQAFPNNRSTRLGRRFLSAEYRWFLENHSDLAFVCETSERIVGFVVGAAPSYGYSIFLATIPMIILSLITHPWLLFNPIIFSDAATYVRSLLTRRPKQKKNNLLPPVQTTKRVSLASIAVSSNFRGQALGQKLLAVFEEQALKLGFTSLGLTVNYENDAARKAYERAGWILRLAKNGKAHYRKQIPNLDEMA